MLSLQTAKCAPQIFSFFLPCSLYGEELVASALQLDHDLQLSLYLVWQSGFCDCHIWLHRQGTVEHTLEQLLPCRALLAPASRFRTLSYLEAAVALRSSLTFRYLQESPVTQLPAWVGLWQSAGYVSFTIDTEFTKWRCDCFKYWIIEFNSMFLTTEDFQEWTWRLEWTKQAWKRSEEDPLGGGKLPSEEQDVLACYLIRLATSLSSRSWPTIGSSASVWSLGNAAFRWLFYCCFLR